MLNLTKTLALVSALSISAGFSFAQTTATAPAAAVAAPQSTGSAAADQVLTRHTFRNVAKQVTPAVVNIRIKNKITLSGNIGRIPPGPGLDKDMREYLERLFESEGWNRRPGQDKDNRYARSGSGVLIRQDGYIVTSEHVVRDVDDGEMEISLSDGRTFSDVEIVGTDTLTDLAVIKINDSGTSNLPYLEWADSDEAQVGDHVLAAGNPLDFTNSVSQGIISAKHRTIKKAALEDLLQTTAMINPGNSGGALVDLDGKLVGINMAIATSTGMWSGLGFAIPSKSAKLVAEQIIAKGKALRGYLGIEMRPLTVGLARQLGYDQEHGIVVADVRPGTAADKAGVQHYDIIASVNGQKIEEDTDMHRNVGNLTAGTTVTLEIWRDEGNGKLKKVTQDVVLGERPDDQSLQNDRRAPRAPGTVPDDQLLGMKLSPGEGGKGLKVDSVNPKSPTEQADVKAGDVILEVNRKPVNSVDEFKEAMKNSNTGSHLLYIERDGTAMLQMVPGD